MHILDHGRIKIFFFYFFYLKLTIYKQIIVKQIQHK